MSTNESDPFDYVSPTDLESPGPNQIRRECESVRIENGDHPDELAIFHAREETADGAWLSALEGGFVELSQMR